MKSSWTEVSAWRLSAFSSPGIAMAGLGLPITIFVPQFYAEHRGLGLATVGTIFMLARIWDVFSDPLMGLLTDRCPSRWGRRRPWIMLSVPILIGSTYQLFMPPAAVTEVYLIGWLFVLYVGWTMLTIPHMAWAADLSDDYNGRSRVQAFREAAETLGVPLVLLVPALIEASSGSNVEPIRMAGVGWFIILTLPIAAIACVRFVEEPCHSRAAHLSLKQMLLSLLENRSLRLLIAADFLGALSGAALGSLFVYQVNDVWRLGDHVSVLMLLYFFAGLGFIPLIYLLSRHYGKSRTLVGTALYYVAFPPAMLLIPEGNAAVAGVMMILLGVNVGGASLLYRAMMADVVDLDEVRVRERRAGLLYGLMATTRKLGGAVAVGLVFWVLAGLGFDPAGENDPDAVARLELVFVAIPVLANLGIAAIIWRFPIGAREQRQLRRELNLRGG